ncbi:MAG: acyltransferase family protein [Moraxellaceae bacterium]|jgi:peptidoglycan/LPS O-acetylase OafA/YrhL|nr:acyltransferase family protein [Moraxellaceae bacterium]
MDYRREIDGLRALAVVPVILFHAGAPGFGGGFVGVDIFLVISGYLITSIILAEMEAGRFSLATFYERRARRILPALFVMMAVCIPFAWLWLRPGELKEFSQSLMAVSVFASNIFFWQESGYFATATELKPLLHTWSLAVEEQFYLLFPLLLMLTWRLGRKWIMVLVAVIALESLAVAHIGAYNNPDRTFFLLPGRIWELAIGVLLAFHLTQPTRPALSAAATQWLSLAGLALITFSIAGYSEATPFPSLYALVPTLGTALLILYARPGTWAGSLLGSRTLVGVGLVSYSAYLWHQPLFAFARHRSLHEPGWALVTALVMATFVLAWLSWRYVERPFRHKGGFSRQQIFGLAVTGSAVLVAAGLFGHLTNGYLLRQDTRANLAQIESRMRVNHGLSQACEGHFTLAAACRTDAQPELLLWGDSYAMHLAQGLLASRPGLKMMQITVSVCGPVLDVAPVDQRYTTAWARQCIASNDKVIDYLRRTPTLKYVVLSSPFHRYAQAKRQLLHRDGQLLNAREAGLHHLEKTLATLRALGKTAVIVSPPPQVGRNIGSCLSRALQFGNDLDTCNFPLTEAERYQQDVYQLLRDVERQGTVIWLAEGICAGGICKAHAGETFIYRDSGHLSREGSAYVGKSMDFYRRISTGH